MSNGERKWAESFRRHLAALQGRGGQSRDGGTIARRLIERAERNARMHLDRGTYRVSGCGSSTTVTPLVLAYPFALVHVSDYGELWTEVDTPRRRSEAYEHPKFGHVRRWTERSVGRKQRFAEWVATAARRQLGVTTWIGEPLHDPIDYGRALFEAGRIVIQRVPRHGALLRSSSRWRSRAEVELQGLLLPFGEFLLAPVDVPEGLVITERYLFALLVREAFGLDVTHPTDDLSLCRADEPLDLAAAQASRKRLLGALDRFFSLLLIDDGASLWRGDARSPVDRGWPQMTLWPDDGQAFPSAV